MDSGIQKSILQMARGAIQERADYEMSSLLNNILDPNTSATAARKLTITLTLKPDDIDQYDGTTSSEEAGGYVKDPTNGCDINFMIIEKSAVIQFEKHVAPKIITPEQNQSADAYKFGYRNVGIADVYENKVAGIYLHHKAKA